MNQWQELNFHFERCFELSNTEQKEYLNSLLTNPAITPALIAELKSLLNGHAQSVSETEFLSSGTNLKNFIATKQNLNPERYQKVSDYLILEKIGNGSFGNVYLAEDCRLGRKVALKITPNLGGEAQTLAKLEHENILRVFKEEVTQDLENRLIALQYVPGPNLQDVIKQINNKSFDNLVDLIEANSTRSKSAGNWEKNHWKNFKKKDDFHNLLNIILKVAKALAYAHEAGVLHLDIKPSNILISPYGEPLLADFNISRTAQLTPESLLVGGTRHYMSPEQSEALSGNSPELHYLELDERSDLYSLGMLLKEVMEKVQDKRVSSLIKEDANFLQQNLMALADKATKKIKDERFSSMNEFLKALEAYMQLRNSLLAQPLGSPLVALIKQKPLFSLILAAGIPHLVGSFVSIAYNYLRIVSHLSLEQKAIFYSTVVLYNFLAMGIGYLFIFRFLKPAIASLNSYRNNPAEYFDKNIDAARSELILTFHQRLFLVGTVGWLAAAPLFPAAIHFLAESITLSDWLHFLISFLLSWIISITYSILFYQGLALPAIIPYTMGAPLQNSSLTEREAREYTSVFNFYFFSASLLPMLMALLILTLDPINFSSGKFPLFRALSALLIVLGMAAYIYASKIKDRLIQFLAQFTSESNHS